MSLVGHIILVYLPLIVTIIGLMIAGVDTVSFPDWEAIDRYEMREGERIGKPREKVVDLAQMMDIVQRNR